MKEALKFCPICDGVSEVVINKILEIANVSRRKNGQRLYCEGDNFTGFYILKSGLVRLSIMSEAGKEILVRNLGSGDVFGQTGMFSGSYLETACLNVDSEFIFLPEKAIKEILLEAPEASQKFLASMGQWTMEFYDRFKTLSLPNARDRVERYLLSEVTPPNTKVSLTLKRHEIASNLGLRPETLSRVLSEMQAEGLIGIEDNVVDLNNLTR